MDYLVTPAIEQVMIGPPLYFFKDPDVLFLAPVFPAPLLSDLRGALENQKICHVNIFILFKLSTTVTLPY